MDRPGQPETGHAFSTFCHRFFFLERGQSGAFYGDGLITQDGTLLQVSEEAPARLRLPAHLDAIAPEAFANCKEITVIAHHSGQIKSWKPVLKAKKCMLYLECEGSEDTQDSSPYNTVCLYFSSVEGFDEVFPDNTIINQGASASGTIRLKDSVNGLIGLKDSVNGVIRLGDSVNDVIRLKDSGNGVIDFDAYDRRLSRVRDPECKLLMALCRILYPYKLSEKARSDYEALLKKRAYPAQTLLVSGIFDRYGLLPERWQEILDLKRPERFIARDLVKHASECGQDRWVEALLVYLGEEGRKANVADGLRSDSGPSVAALSSYINRDAASSENAEATSCDNAEAASSDNAEAAPSDNAKATPSDNAEAAPSDNAEAASCDNMGAASSGNMETTPSDSTEFAAACVALAERCPELSGCLAAEHEEISVLFGQSIARVNTAFTPDMGLRLLAHILFHEIFEVWKGQWLFASGEKSLEGPESRRDFKGSGRSETYNNQIHSLLFCLAADIAAEYQVDEHLGYEPAKAWERQLVYDAIRRDHQSCKIFSSHPGKSFLTVKEAYTYVESLYLSEKSGFDFKRSQSAVHMPAGRQANVLTDIPANIPADVPADVPADFPPSVAHLQMLFTAFDIHPVDSVNKPQSVGDCRTPGPADRSWIEEIGKGLPDDSGRARRNGLRSHSISAGRDFAGEHASLKKREGHDYKAFLRQFMVSGETRTLDLDSFDPVYYTLGLTRYDDMPFVEPLETKEVLRLDELVIVIDTSGSCSGPMVRFFLEETWSVFRQEENFFDRFHVHILQCDAMVQKDTKLTTLEEAEQYMSDMMIHGGGNTDFRPAFRYIRALQRKGELRRLKGIIYFTDGFGTFPQRGDAPACKTVFVSLRKQFDQVEVPVWAERLLLEPPEGADWATAYTGAFQSNIYNK